MVMISFLSFNSLLDNEIGEEEGRISIKINFHSTVTLGFGLF